MAVRSEEFRKALQKARKQKATGFLSVTGKEGAKQVYGTLHVLKGRLVKAEYGNLNGKAAVDMMSTLPSPIVSFASSQITDEGGADLPNIAKLIGSGKSAKAAKEAKASGSKGGFKIFPQVLLTMFLVSLVPLGALWFITNAQARAEARAATEASLRQTADELAGEVDAWISTNLSVIEQNASLNGMKSMQAGEQNPILESINNTYDWTYLIFTMDAEGNNVGRSDGGSLRFYGDRQYFQQVAQGEPIGQQVLIGRSSGKPALILSGPIQEDNGAFGGVLAFASHLEDVSNTITAASIGKTGYAILLGETGQAIAHGRPELITETLQDLSNYPALAAPAGQQVVFEQGGKEVVARTATTDLGWTLIVQQDYAEAFAGLRAAERNALFLLIGTVLFVVIVASLMARRLVEPIQSLTKAAENISRGELGEEIRETKRGDEIGTLARAVERMGVSIKMAFEELNASQEAR